MSKRNGREPRKEEKKGQPQIVFRLEEDERVALIESAKRDGRDLSSLMRKLCKDHLAGELVSAGK